MDNGQEPLSDPVSAGPRGFQEAYHAVGGTGLPQKGGRTTDRGSRTTEPPLDLLPRRIQGRDALKPELVAALRPQRRGVRVLHGIAGGGKSSLALWLARQARDQGRPVYWVRNRDVEQTMHAVALRRGVDVGQLGRADARDVVWRSLESATEPWLLVFDNIDDTDDTEHRGLFGGSGARLDGTGWIRPSRAGLVLVTTRHGDPAVWGEHAELTRVTCLDGEDGARVLLDLAPHAGPREDARLLADRLGGLPLALRLAGHYLANDPPRHRTFADYRRAVEHDLDLLDAAEPTPATLEDDEAARRSIRLTWELTLALLEERRLGRVRPLLHLLTCYGAPHPIPQELLVAERLHGTPVDPGGTLTEGGLTRLVRNLVSSALADQTDVAGTPHLALHPLLAEVVAAARDESPHADDTWDAAVALVDEATPDSGEPAAWAGLQALPAVVTAVLAWVPAHLDALPVAVECGSLCAGYLLRSGALQASHDMSELALRRANTLDLRDPVRFQARLAAAVVGTTEGNAAARDELAALWHDARDELPHDHQFLVVVRQHLAESLWLAGEYDDAEDIYLDLLADHERGVEPDLVTATRFGYGRMMCLRGRFDEAEREISAVLAAERELFDDPDHPDVLITRAVLADVWLGQGELLKARDELQDVLRRQERVHGPDSPLTLSARVTLMAVHAQLRDHGQAEVQLNQLLRIQRDALNPEHPLSLLGLAALISTRSFDLSSEGDPRTDERRLTEVAEAMARQLGDDNPSVLSTLLGAAVQRCRYDEEGGFAAVRDVLERQLEVMGPHHIATMNTRLLHAQLLVEIAGDGAAAEEELRGLLATQLELIGPDSPHTATTRTVLADVVLRNGDRDGAEELTREALEALERLHGPDHADTRKARLAVAQLRCLDERLADAEPELVALIESLRRTDPGSDEHLAAQVMLALVRSGDERLEEAESELRQVLATLSGMDDDGHRYDRLMVQWFLATVLTKRDAATADRAALLAEAESLLADSIAGLVELGDPDDDVANVRQSYAELLHDAGRLAEAERQAQLVLANVAADDQRGEEARVLLQTVSADLAESAGAVSSAESTGAATAGTTPEPPEDPASPEPAAPTAGEPTSEEAGRPPADRPSWQAFLAGSGPRPDAAPPPVDRRPDPAATPPAPTPAPVFPAPAPPAPASPVPAAPASGSSAPVAPAPAAPASVPPAPALWPLESGLGYREDLRACAEAAARLREPGLTDPERADLRHRYALLLADLGFPFAAHAELCAAFAAHQRLGTGPTAGLACLVDLVLAGPRTDDSTDRVDRAEERVTAELGADHPLVQRLRRARAELWAAAGEAARAVAELADLLARAPHPDAERAALRRSLAVAVRLTGDRGAAERLHREAVAAYRELHGDDHPHVLRARADLAAAGADAVGAIPVLREVLDRQVRRRGAWHPEVAATRHHLGVAAAAAGDRATAVAELGLAVRLLTRRLGARDPRTRASEAELARVRG